MTENKKDPIQIWRDWEKQHIKEFEDGITEVTKAFMENKISMYQFIEEFYGIAFIIMRAREED